MQESWIAISAARAKAHRLYGVRGWLVTLLWLNTLPIFGLVTIMVGPWRLSSLPIATMNWLPALFWAVWPLALVVLAFVRLRLFPMVLVAYSVIFQLPFAFILAFGSGRWMSNPASWSSAKLPFSLLSIAEVVTPIATLAYVLRSRRMRVTYRHQVRDADSAAVPAVFDRPGRNETPTDATEHARERAALRRVTHELSSGVLDTQTWMHVMRHHADASDSARTAAYVRARMATLCPPAHVHPPLLRMFGLAIGAALVTLAVAALLVTGLFVLSSHLSGGSPAAGLGGLTAIALPLCWLAGLFAGARFLRAVA